ncbi:MAG: PilZ domain-containing protein [Vicinamibacterales bacterium]
MQHRRGAAQLSLADTAATGRTRKRLAERRSGTNVAVPYGMKASYQHAATELQRDQRQSPRVEVWEAVQVRFPELQLEGRIVDVSLGGFGVRLNGPVSVDSEPLIEFSLDDAHVTVRARTAFCHVDASNPNGSEHVAGFAFLWSEDQTPVAATLLTDRVLGSISFL